MGENHEPVDFEEFHRRAGAGGFALCWQAHGLGYGIPAIVDEWLRGGKIVIANGSRSILDAARDRYSPLLVVSVTAPAEVLVERLRGRAREDAWAVHQRLARADLLPVAGDDVLSLENSGPPEVAGDLLFRRLVALDQTDVGFARGIPT